MPFLCLFISGSITKLNNSIVAMAEPLVIRKLAIVSSFIKKFKFVNIEKMKNHKRIKTIKNRCYILKYLFIY